MKMKMKFIKINNIFINANLISCVGSIPVQHYGWRPHFSHSIWLADGDKVNATYDSKSECEKSIKELFSMLGIDENEIN